MNETRPLNAQVWKRDDLDWYVEESRASAALFRVERFVGGIWDPACGSGNIVQSAIAELYGAIGTDIVQRVDADWFSRWDFLIGEPLGAFEANIVCNPPFFKGKGTEAFIRKALALATGKVCVFASLPFLAGDKRRKGLFAEYPPHRVWIVTPRVSCPPGEWLEAGNKAGGGTEDWCWLVWDKTAPFVSTTLLWLEALAAHDALDAAQQARLRYEHAAVETPPARRRDLRRVADVRTDDEHASSARRLTNPAPGRNTLPRDGSLRKSRSQK